MQPISKFPSIMNFSMSKGVSNFEVLDAMRFMQNGECLAPSGSFIELFWDSTIC